MKRLLLILGFSLVLLPQPARAAFVQGAVNNANATSVTCTEPGNVTLGNLEIVGVKENGGAFGGTPITSTRVTTWNTVTTNSAVAYWYGKVTSTGAETVTVNLNLSNLVAILCAEYSINTTNDTFTGVSASSQNITTTKTNSTLVCLAGGGATIAFSGGAGFTLRETAILLTGPNGHLLLGDVDEASTGTYTCNTANGGSGVVIANFYVGVVAVPRHR
jgi:hypothetical protein